jgi:hypothetical protein
MRMESNKTDTLWHRSHPENNDPSDSSIPLGKF